ncbi:SDR family oxidoreductase [Bradyrhizobium sp. LA7.1]|uniref:SDR family oxidoreductase n=1 Tax=Bradyrhizobium sp. LA7.1 TaxID=3156324 RepID=UPI003394A863
MSTLKNKVAIVTGASSGIGAETAKAFARSHAKVVLIGRRADRLKALEGEIREAGGEAFCITCDMTKRNDVDKAFAKSVAEHGPASILVNNAGVMLLGRFERGLADEWKQMEALNVQAALYASFKAIDQMKGIGGGVIVHVSSTAGRGPRLLNGAYAATKAAILAAAESMRQELIQHNIRVCTVIPGAVATDLADHVTDEEAKGALAGLLKMKRLEPEDVARAIVYAAEQPPYVSINEILIRPTQQPF